MTYFFTFLFSILLCYIGENLNRKNHNFPKFKFASYICFECAVLLLVLLAGFRDYSVGTDTSGYGLAVFRWAKQANSLSDLIKSHGVFVADSSSTQAIEILYLVLNYAISRLTDSPHWAFAMIGLIIYGGFFIGIYRFREKISITYAWVFFILLMFAYSMNMMRQMMAMAIMFMGSIHIIKQKYWRFVPYIIVAFFFHQTAVLFAATFIVIRILLLRANRRIYKAIILIGSVAVILAYNELLDLAISIGILTEKMGMYSYQESASFSLNPFIHRFIPIVLLLSFSKASKKTGNESDFFVCTMLLDLIFIQMRSLGLGGERVSIYFSMINILSYPYFLNKIQLRSNRHIIFGILTTFLLAAWVYQTVLLGGSGIYPYTSELLGIN